jgi:hypothetical protein
MFTVGGVVYDAQGNPVGQVPGTPEAEQAATGGGRTLGGQVRNARRRAQVAVGRGAQGAQEFLAKYPQAGGYARGGLAIAGAIPAVGESLEELQEGRPLGAVAALAPAGLSAVGAGLIGKGVPGTIAGLGLMGLGAILPGAAAQGAEATRQSVTGKPTKGKEGEFSTQLAMAQQIGELGATQYRNQMGTYTSALKDLSNHYSNQNYLDLQRNIPLIEKMKNNEVVRQQALMNTQGQLQGMLGVLATGGALAQGAQAETGATLRTALTSAPYAGSVLQAPQIRFG